MQVQAGHRRPPGWRGAEAVGAVEPKGRCTAAKTFVAATAPVPYGPWSAQSACAQRGRRCARSRSAGRTRPAQAWRACSRSFPCGRAFHEHASEGTVAFALDQVAFPVVLWCRVTVFLAVVLATRELPSARPWRASLALSGVRYPKSRFSHQEKEFDNDALLCRNRVGAGRDT